MIDISEFMLIANRFHLRAEELRMLAMTYKDGANKQTLFEVAEMYDEAAEKYLKRHKLLRFKSFWGRWT